MRKGERLPERLGMRVPGTAIKTPPGWRGATLEQAMNSARKILERGAWADPRYPAAQAIAVISRNRRNY